MRYLALFVAVVVSGCSGSPGDESATNAPAADGWFADVTASWNVDFVHDAGTTDERHLPETMGAGAALFDANEDGALDLYFVQSGPFPPSQDSDATNRLYLNEGSGILRDATSDSGAAADTGYGMGVCTGDVDGDGHEDLYVTNFGPDVLLHGDGKASFTDVTRAAGLGDPRWTSGAIFFDADLDGDLDLYVAAYLAIDVTNPIWCGRREEGWRSYCHPDRYEGLDDRFHVNRGDGTFSDGTAAAGLAGSNGKGLGAIACDLDGDADLDLYVANDSTENRLWWNDGNGVFEDGTLLSGTGVNVNGLTEAGMGVASGDVDGDGDFDLFVTNFDDESNTLYENEGGGFFGDGTVRAGLEAKSRLPVGFGTLLEDFDHDGDLDLAVANGHIIHNIHLYHDGKTHAQLLHLFANDGKGRFSEVAECGAPCRTPFVGRGLYSGDLDGDGDLDLVLTQCDGPARIFRNDASRTAAITLRGLPRGSQVRAHLASRTLVREAGSQPSYFGQSSADVHIGLGGERVSAISIRAPGSEWSRTELEVAGGELRAVLDENVWRVVRD